MNSRLPDDDRHPVTAVAAIRTATSTRRSFFTAVRLNGFAAGSSFDQAAPVLTAKSHKSLQGQLLLDGGKLRGSAFHRSVVLVCQHDPRGAFGLVLNKPTDRKLTEVIDSDLPEGLKQADLFSGGPVQPSAMSYLFSNPDLPEGNVMEHLSHGHDLTELVALGKSWSPLQKLRVFAGYAGWAPGQLDDELRRDAWLLHPASVSLVFRTSPEDLWRYILHSKGDWQSRLLAESPEDLSWN